MSRTISSGYTSGITLTNTADNIVTVTSTGSISKPSGSLGALYGRGGSGKNWTIDNSGTIAGGNSAGGMYLGGFSSAVTNGVVINQAGGLIQGNLYALFVNGPSTITNNLGATIAANSNAAMYLRGASTVVNYGVIQDTLNTGIYMTDGGTVINHAGATISAPTIGVRVDAVTTVINSGTITGIGTDAILFGASSTSNRLVMNPGAVLNGKVSGGQGTLELGAGTASSLGNFGSTGITNFSTLQFDSGASWTVTGNTSSSGLGTVAISGFNGDDTIHLTGFNAVSGSFTSNALVLTNAGSAHATLHVQGSFASGDFTVASDGSGGTNITVACFLSGTRIATEAADVAVENLRPGDLVRTETGGLRPVKWIGRRSMECARHPEPRAVHPVRIARDAFGAGLPRRDLFLSPDHAVFVPGEPGVLIPVQYLINGATVAPVAMPTVDYFHVELDGHDVLLAEGLPAESYLDTGNRGAFANGGGAVMLHPDFALRVWETQSCAPLVVTGPMLAAAKVLLLRQAARLGHEQTVEADVHLMVDERRIEPCRDGELNVFELPEATQRVRLVSRSGTPARLLAASEDHRQLGIAVARLTIDGRDIPLADPRCGAGWHPAEPGWRWTDGDAAINCPGAVLLTVSVPPMMRYWGQAAGRPPMPKRPPAPPRRRATPLRQPAPAA